MRLWSVSTTVRNPDRIRNFLQILRSMEGEIWDIVSQEKFQILLIQNKLYGFGNPQFSNNLTLRQRKWLESNDLTYKQSKEILKAKNYVGGGDMRGRQSFNPIEKMGLSYIDDNKRVRISSFGNYFLQSDYDIGEVFFRSLIKWQYPNPDLNKYKAEDGYNIKPFIASLKLISLVNGICKNNHIKEKGVSRHEFAIFFLTLSNYKDIDYRANEIIEFRREYDKLKSKEDKLNFSEKYFLSNFIEYESWSNALDYTDNIIRYFRLTRFFYIRGNGWYVDLEPRRNVEINELIKFDNASAQSFETKKEYIDYIGDIYKPILPWENKKTLKRVIANLIKDIEEKQNALIKIGMMIPEKPSYGKELNNIDLLKRKVDELRTYIRKMSDIESQHYSKTRSNIETYIESLKNIFSVQADRSVELERLITLSLNALNDALRIKPNYPVGDDNQPTFTAPANMPDIECYYNSFNAICEVTLLTNRSQWFNEGQPVMRHIRDFEKSNSTKDVYCLFIAPKLHRDTINTFWFSVKYEYEGNPQKIIPLTINQFTYLLEVLLRLKEENKFLTHQKIKDLYDSIINQTKSINSSNNWISNIPKIIKIWGESL
jgi:hypothetical protein